ncbi:glycosyltransferase family 39 protein [Kitasatospora sp. GP82]|uniref:ArnT family glycosyltransferase n=1 Tax=Kitasatospora sp. GP82 TaxID=3035089 RepID=UPI002475FE14|nr:glycosyltransferase family 39 protein [Kitasatospora sp. GP82]MDH6125443.1 4-amino-4-deoxy-L-arabinose transferase-like glycosyltransferase [Kitasatospora sp. GP82]
MANSLLAAPAESTAVQAGARGAPWRSPEDQPGYARPALLGIAALAAVLYAWNIDQSSFHSFYADAVRSMTESWKAFVFGSFDPANTITLDKLPGFLWPQALSARIFGFHPWALTLPQVIEGVLSVLVLYKVVRRWAGANAALLAAAAFTLTPVAAGLFRTAVEDPAFTLLLLLAADAAQRAAHTARLRPLLLAGVWVGLAFQTKMLEAWAVLPALGAVYLLSAPTSLRRRFGHVALAGLVTVAVSASWMLVVTLTPAKDRPYVDGTTDNSAFSMVVGYNFLNRFSSLGVDAADTGSVQAVRGGPGGSGGAGGSGWSGGQRGGEVAGTHYGDTGGGPASRAGAADTPSGAAAAGATAFHGGGGAGGGRSGGNGGGGRSGGGGGGQDGGWTKMFSSQFAPQTGWLYPLAAIAALCGLAWRRGKPRTDVLRAGLVMWGTWLAVFFLVFSAGSVGGHSYYMGVIATPLAALSGAGIVLLWRAYRAGGPQAWALPAAITATVAWCAVLAWRFPDFMPWSAPTAIALGAAALALLGAANLPRFAGRRLAMAGLLAGITAMLVTPGAWAASVLDSKYGNSGMGTVGPAGGFGNHGGSPRSAAGPSQGGGGGGFGGGGFGGRGGESTGLSASQQTLLSYLKAHRGGATYLFATSSWSSASPFILATGEEVLPMGGFSGGAPSPTLPQFQQLVASGKLHYVLLGGAGFSRSSAQSPTAAVQDWVRGSCTAVPAGQYGGSSQSDSGSGGFHGLGGGAGAQPEELYRCPANG